MKCGKFGVIEKKSFFQILFFVFSSSTKSPGHFLELGIGACFSASFFFFLLL